MIGLSNPSARPLFQYYDQATDSLKDVTYPDGFQPRRIDNYVLDPADWRPETRASKGKRSSRSNSNSIGPPHGTKTRAAILAHGVDDTEPCFICGRQGTRCFGDSCVRSFRRRVERVVRAGKVRIERVEIPGVALAYGVFASLGIRKGDLVGEYLGRLHPLDKPERLEGGHMYAFELEGVATVDAREYGSITRFVNHHCQPNLDVQIITYGRRRCIAFVANRDIGPGEQLFIHYGDDYFRERRPCLCDVVSYPHVPGKGNEPPLKVQDSFEQLRPN